MRHYLFDWGDTLMVDLPDQAGPMSGWPQVAAVPGAVETLARLHGFARCHLATNARDSDGEQIRRALARVQLDRWIEQIFCYREVGHAKPSRAYFTTAASILQVPVTDLTMIGDDLENDVLGALKCGLQAIWYNPQGRPCPDGIVAIEDLRELVSLP